MRSNRKHIRKSRVIRGVIELEEDIENYKLGSTIQEFEELFGNTPFEDIEKIKKYIFNNYIPKSKVKEKIEEIKNEDLEIYDTDSEDVKIAKYEQRAVLDICEELLGEE